jgi:hypothetical protein
MLDQFMAELVIEKEPQRSVSLIHDIDHEHLHFLVTQARESWPWNFAIRRCDTYIGIVAGFGIRCDSRMQILDERVPEALLGEILGEPFHYNGIAWDRIHGLGGHPVLCFIAVGIDVVIDGFLIGIGLWAGQRESFLLTIAVAAEFLSLALAVGLERLRRHLTRAKRVRHRAINNFGCARDRFQWR